jgi:hypothetical protein
MKEQTPHSKAIGIIQQQINQFERETRNSLGASKSILEKKSMNVLLRDTDPNHKSCGTCANLTVGGVNIGCSYKLNSPAYIADKLYTGTIFLYQVNCPGYTPLRQDHSPIEDRDVLKYQKE